MRGLGTHVPSRGAARDDTCPHLFCWPLTLPTVPMAHWTHYMGPLQHLSGVGCVSFQPVPLLRLETLGSFPATLPSCVALALSSCSTIRAELPSAPPPGDSSGFDPVGQCVLERRDGPGTELLAPRPKVAGDFRLCFQKGFLRLEVWSIESQQRTGQH